MADSYTEFTHKLSETVVGGMDRLQTAQLDLIERVRETVNEYLPNLPELDLPFADSLPSAHQIASANFALAEDVLEAQKKFTLALLAPAKKKKGKKAKKVKQAA